ncbi:hypothetical protein DQ04_08191030 [Trypanosoma grayi]|uniref:hypothetical protein n=1 Tax=Trypanosoma grayi TaxID=71804 RepID=UPI0004F482C6|nr:hypothetical protein DQ04_08191030 [Trypanosoma grayi]KEG08028.1 hypothetical protein DQ04_08191030 [Trypanosoma grayi]
MPGAPTGSSSAVTDHARTLLDAYAGREGDLLEELRQRMERRTGRQQGVAAQPERSELRSPTGAASTRHPFVDGQQRDEEESGEEEEEEEEEEITVESIRCHVESGIGFASPLHRRRWEEAWLGALPLSAYMYKWGDAVVHQGAGYKLTTHGGLVRRWARRYFVLAWSLLYVFDDRGAKGKCRGAVYMHRAGVHQTSANGRPAIVITPVTQKKPSELGAEEFASFTMSVDAVRLLGVWLGALQKTSVAPLSPTSVACRSTPQRSANVATAPETAPVNVLRHEQPVERNEEKQLSQTPQREKQRLHIVSVDCSGHSEDRDTVIEEYRHQLQRVVLNASNVKARLRRIAAKKDKQQLGELLLQFVLNRVDDAAGLWALMDQVEELPDAPPHTPPASTACVAGENHSTGPISPQSASPRSGVANGGAAVKGAPLYITPIPVERHMFSPQERTGDGGTVQRINDSKNNAVERGEEEEEEEEGGVFGGADAALFSAETGSAWRQRMRRLRDRQRVVDSILSELPSMS